MKHITIHGKTYHPFETCDYQLYDCGELTVTRDDVVKEEWKKDILWYEKYKENA